MPRLHLARNARELSLAGDGRLWYTPLIARRFPYRLRHPTSQAPHAIADTPQPVLPTRPRVRLLFILAQDITDALFQTVEIPLPLIADNGAQQRVDLANGVQ